MEISKTLMGVVGLVVALLLIATVAVPLVDELEVTKAETRYNDDIDGRYSQVQSLTISSVDSSVTLDGVAFTPSKSLVVISETISLVYSSGWFWRGIVDSEQKSTTLGAAWSLTVTGSTWTFNDGTDSYTGTSAQIFVLDEDGDYCVVPAVGVAYVTPGDKAYLIFANVVDSSMTYVFGAIESITSETGTANMVNDNGIQAKVSTWQSTTVDGALTISGATVPFAGSTKALSVLTEYSYTAQVPDENNIAGTLFGVVVTLLVIVPVMMAVRLIGGRD